MYFESNYGEKKHTCNQCELATTFFIQQKIKYIVLNLFLHNNPLFLQQNQFNYPHCVCQYATHNILNLSTNFLTFNTHTLNHI